MDEYMRDQVAVFQALAKGGSEVFGGRSETGEILEASLHAQTAQWVSGKMLGIRWSDDSSCEGIGYAAGEKLSERKTASLASNKATMNEDDLDTKMESLEL